MKKRMPRLPPWQPGPPPPAVAAPCPCPPPACGVPGAAPESDARCCCGVPCAAAGCSDPPHRGLSVVGCPRRHRRTPDSRRRSLPQPSRLPPVPRTGSLRRRILRPPPPLVAPSPPQSRAAPRLRGPPLSYLHLHPLICRAAVWPESPIAACLAVASAPPLPHSRRRRRRQWPPGKAETAAAAAAAGARAAAAGTAAKVPAGPPQVTEAMGAAAAPKRSASASGDANAFFLPLAIRSRQPRPGYRSRLRTSPPLRYSASGSLSGKQESVKAPKRWRRKKQSPLGPFARFGSVGRVSPAVLCLLT